MSKELDLNELKKQAAKEAEHSKTMTTAEKLRQAGILKDPLKAAIDRAEEAKKAKEKEEEERLAERRRDEDTQYELRDEVTGFNIGDSIARRMEKANETMMALKEELDAEELERAISDEATAKPEVKKVVKKQPKEIEESDEDDDDDVFNLSVESHSKSKSDYNIVKETINPKEETTIMNEAVKEVKKEEIKEEVVLVKEEAAADVTEFSQASLDIDDEDLKDIEEDIDEEEETEEEKKKNEELKKRQEAALEDLKGQIKDRIQSDVIKNRSKDGTVKISKKAVSLTEALRKSGKGKRAVTYPLMSAGRNITMAEFARQDIEDLNTSGSGKNKFDALKDRYLIIYEHDLSENKPDFETWLKTTSFMDLEHIMMAIYKSSFFGANYIPYSCTDEDCGYLFLSDDTLFEKMAKFKDDEARTRFYDIFNSTETQAAGVSALYETKIVDVSESFAIGFREPSIYNTIFENSVLDDKFINKYKDLLTIMVYIDNIYMIDEDGEYHPIEYKVYKDNIRKTTKMRIATFCKILKVLTSDEFARIQGEIESIVELGNLVTYQLPETTCPKCGKKIEATPQNAQQLLFARHRLNLLAQ